MDVAATQSPGIQQLGSEQQHQHRRGHHAVIDAAASALGMTKQDVRKALHSGQSLGDMAKTQGVDTGALQDAIKTGLKQADPTLSTDRADALASQIVAHRRTAPAPVSPVPVQSVAAEPAPPSGRLIDVTV